MRAYIIDFQPMRRISDFRVRYGHCDRSLPFPLMYRISLTKIYSISRGPCSEPQSISKMCLLTLSICRYFPCWFIDAYSVLLSRLYHILGRG